MNTADSYKHFSDASLDNAREILLAGLDMSSSGTDSMLASGRIGAQTFRDWLMSLADGEAPAPPDHHRAVALYCESIHALAEQHANLVSGLLRQMQLCREQAHRSLESLQQWIPGGTDYLLSTTEIIGEAVGKSLQGYAEAGIDVSQFIEAHTQLVVESATGDEPGALDDESGEGDTAQPKPRRSRQRAA